MSTGGDPASGGDEVDSGGEPAAADGEPLPEQETPAAAAIATRMD